MQLEVFTALGWHSEQGHFLTDFITIINQIIWISSVTFSSLNLFMHHQDKLRKIIFTYNKNGVTKYCRTSYKCETVILRKKVFQLSTIFWSSLFINLLYLFRLCFLPYSVSIRRKKSEPSYACIYMKYNCIYISILGFQCTYNTATSVCPVTAGLWVRGWYECVCVLKQYVKTTEMPDLTKRALQLWKVKYSLFKACISC